MFQPLQKTWQRYKKLPRTVFSLSFVSLLNDTSSEIIYPLLPLFLALTLGASPAAIGAIEGLAESVSSLLKLAVGYYSDKLHKRKAFVLLGYSLSSLVRPFLGFAMIWQQVLLFRFVDRLGKGIRSAPRDALVAAVVKPEERGLAFGVHRAFDNAGAVIGPLIAFFLLKYFAENPTAPTASDYKSLFLMASIPALLAVLVVAFFVRDKENEPQNITKTEKQDLTAKNKAVFSSSFYRFIFIIALFTLCNSSDVFLLLRAQEVGVTATWIPLLWAFLNLSKVLSSLIGGDWSDRIGRKTLIFIGWMVYALVYAGFAFINSAWQAWLLFLVYGIYFGLTEGVEKALVADLVPSEKRGTAYGWYNLAIGITVFPASLLFGQLWNQFNAETAFLVSAAIGIVSAFLILTVGKADENESAIG